MWTLILTIMVYAPSSYASSSTTSVVPGFADDAICQQSGRVWLGQLATQPHSEAQRVTGFVTCVYTPFPNGGHKP